MPCCADGKGLSRHHTCCSCMLSKPAQLCLSHFACSGNTWGSQPAPQSALPRSGQHKAPLPEPDSCIHRHRCMYSQVQVCKDSQCNAGFVGYISPAVWRCAAEARCQCLSLTTCCQYLGSATTGAVAHELSHSMSQTNLHFCSGAQPKKLFEAAHVCIGCEAPQSSSKSSTGHLTPRFAPASTANKARCPCCKQGMSSSDAHHTHMSHTSERLPVRLH